MIKFCVLCRGGQNSVLTIPYFSDAENQSCKEHDALLCGLCVCGGEGVLGACGGVGGCGDWGVRE